MTFMGGFGICKDNWEEIERRYKELIEKRKELLDLIMQSTTSNVFHSDSRRANMIIGDDIRKALVEEHQHMRARLCNLTKEEYLKKNGWFSDVKENNDNWLKERLENYFKEKEQIKGEEE